MNKNYRRFVAGDRKNRHKNDLYCTPPNATRAVLEVEDLLGNVWEPACGRGHMVEVLRAQRTVGRRVYATDLYDHGFGRPGVDFLSRPPLPRGVRTIFMNPPYKHALKFIQTALSYRDVTKVVVLLRLTFLEGGRRREFFQDSGLARVWVHSTRVNVSRAGKQFYKKDGRGGMVPFAWFVWVRGHRRRPVLGWLP